MYNKDPQLRCAGEQIEYTREMLEEYIKCKEDVIYFAEHYFRIISEKGEHLIELREYQKRMIRAMVGGDGDPRPYIACVAARQIGKTTISTVYLTHFLLFNENKNVAILANREKTAIDILNKVKLAYRGLPLWLQQGISDEKGGWTKTAFGLENGCKCLSSSTAAAAIRGMSISLLFLDEFAFVPQEIADDFFSSVYPTITRDPNAKIVIVSTPNGLNHFYDIYKGAVSNENNFRPIKVNWWEVEGQDDAWKKRIIRDIGPVKFNQEYNGKFLGSSSTLIDADVLERIKIQQPVATKFGDLMVIFEQPKTGSHHYILGIDSAGGTGADYSIIQVLKVNAHNDIRQVATYANNMISPHAFAEVCIAVSDYYLNAQMMVENNEMGGQVADKIWYDFECDRVLNTDVKGIGTRSTRKSKLIANMLLKRYLEEGWLHVVNKESIRQMAMYEEITPNVFKGPRTDHDDHVAGLLWALYYLQTPFFEGDTTSVRRSIKEVYKIIPDDETDKAMMMRNPAYQDKAERMGETDEGESPPILDDDGTDFEWPADLDD